MRQRTIFCGSLTVVAGLLAMGWSASAGGEKKTGSETQPVTDAQFAQLASASDLAEINLGNIAKKQADSADVKQFAERMVADHTKSSKMLIQIANKKGLTVASQMDAQHQALAAKLVAMKGSEFDRAYMKHMVMDHKKAVALFQSATSSVKDGDLRAFATKTLPIIQEHFKMAQQISGKLTTGGKQGAER